MFSRWAQTCTGDSLGRASTCARNAIHAPMRNTSGAVTSSRNTHLWRRAARPPVIMYCSFTCCLGFLRYLVPASDQYCRACTIYEYTRTLIKFIWFIIWGREIENKKNSVVSPNQNWKLLLLTGPGDQTMEESLFVSCYLSQFYLLLQCQKDLTWSLGSLSLLEILYHTSCLPVGVGPHRKHSLERPDRLKLGRMAVLELWTAE